VRAAVQDRYGLDALRVDEVADPVPGRDEVLVRVEAAGVDRGTWHLATGLPYVARLGIGLRRPRYRIPGRDVAGTVASVGPGVTAFAPGDPVYGTADGSFAELAVVPVRRLARRPASLTALESAAVPVSALTAYQAIRAAGVGPGQRVLVVGASGGVGTFAVQMAVAAGARVTGVCSPAKAELVRSLGAAHVIDHTREAVDAEGVPYDVVLDIGGNRRLSELRRILTERGTLVVIGGEDGGRLTGGIQRSIGAVLLSAVVRQRLVMHYSREVASDLERVTALIEAGDVRPVVERAWTLEEAAAAIEHVGAGRARGKSVIDVAGEAGGWSARATHSGDTGSSD
jgi:NADPH:quinone reductase-like Zn-dependent oxidoreductase